MAVEVALTGHDLEISPRLRAYVEKKVSKLDRFLDTIHQADVELAYQKTARSATDRQVAQMTVRGRGLLLRTEERSDDIFAAVDAALDKMQRQIERYKGKHRRSRGDGTSASAVGLDMPPAPADEDESLRVVRRKRFAMRPMDELEAIEEMGQIGHEDFFVFYNSDTNTVNVLYRRRDGYYGLIQPELG